MHFSVSIDKNTPCAYETLISKCIRILELSKTHVKTIFEQSISKKHEEFKFSCMREQANSIQAAFVSSKVTTLAQDLRANANVTVISAEPTSAVKVSSDSLNNEIKNKLAPPDMISIGKVTLEDNIEQTNNGGLIIDTKQGLEDISSHQYIDNTEKTFDNVYKELFKMQELEAFDDKEQETGFTVSAFDNVCEKTSNAALRVSNTPLQADISILNTASSPINEENIIASEKAVSIEELAESITMSFQPHLKEDESVQPVHNSTVPKASGYEIFSEFPSKRSLDDILEGNVVKITNTEKAKEDFEKIPHLDLLSESMDMRTDTSHVDEKQPLDENPPLDSSYVAKAAFHRDTTAFKKILFECKDEYHSYTEAIRNFCIQYGVCFPEFEIVRENDVFRCTATFLRLNFVSSYEYDKQDSKNSACKKILDYVSRNWEKIFAGKPASMYII